MYKRQDYNRAGVERVMGFCDEKIVRKFLEDVPKVEKSMVDSGIILIKYWLEVDMDVQDERLRARDEDPRKIWKLTPMDIKSYTRWYDYSRARDAMFAATDTPDTPWYVVDANDKRRARLNCITHLLSQVPNGEIERESVVLPERVHNPDYIRQPLPGEMFIPSVY